MSSFKIIKSRWTPETLKDFFDVLYTKSKYFPRQVSVVSLTADMIRLLKINIEDKYAGLLIEPKNYKYKRKRLKRDSVQYVIRVSEDDHKTLRNVYYTLYKNEVVYNFYSIVDLAVTILKNDCLEQHGELLNNTVDLPEEYLKYLEKLKENGTSD